jgi:hypothetical protein
VNAKLAITADGSALFIAASTLGTHLQYVYPLANHSGVDTISKKYKVSSAYIGILSLQQSVSSFTQKKEENGSVTNPYIYLPCEKTYVL